MTSHGSFTREEILSQTSAWGEARDVVAQHNDMIQSLGGRAVNRCILHTGCGSTYYLSLAAAAHLRGLTGRCTQAVPASELWFYPHAYIRPDDILIAISRSGRTTETLHAAEVFERVTHRSAITIQCYADAPLAQRAGLQIVTTSGAERSVVQTRSFASMFVATVALNAHWAQRTDLVDALRDLPQAGERVLQSATAPARDWGRRLQIDRMYFLGSGVRYGLACEASLKMKEMTLSHAEPFHFLEFRHGPKSMVTDTTLVVGLVSDEAAPAEMRVLSEAAALGAQVYVLGERVEPVGGGPAVSFTSGLPAETRDVLYLPPLQLLAYERALAKGLDPDRPRHLDAIVAL